MEDDGIDSFLCHVGIEKLTCSTVSMDPDDDKEYIRIIANSAPRPIPKCQGGPGASCSFHQFTVIVDEGMRAYGDFDGICHNNDDDDDEEKNMELYTNCRGRLDVLYSLYMYNEYEIEYCNNFTEYLGKLFPWF